MRPIKFRAWDKLSKSMRPDAELQLSWIRGNDDFELMQFTGLLDQNGKEVYEGDIIEHYDFFNKPIEKLVVEYRLGSFRYYRKDEPETALYFPQNSVAVVGNIYERN